MSDEVFTPGYYLPGGDAKTLLATILWMIKENDENYDLRESLIYGALRCAKIAGYAVGIRIDPREPDWPVAFVELPTGQISFHLRQHRRMWDGHTTEEKYKRVDEFLKSVAFIPGLLHD